jgi:hypothetical protein
MTVKIACVVFAPSIAHTRSGHCRRAYCNIARYSRLSMANLPVASSSSRPSRTSIDTDRLCGSTPMITRSITASSSLTV